MPKKPTIPATAAESVTLETLQLLQQTVDYLNRLPPVPVTRQLVRELQAHLDAPHVRAVQREAEATERAALRLQGATYAVSGLPMFDVVVEQSVAYVLAPPWAQTIHADPRLDRLHRGVRVDLKQAPVGFVPWHEELVLK